LAAGALSAVHDRLSASAGTSRHALALEPALRPLFSYLKAVVVPSAVFAASEDWGGPGGVDGALAARIARAAGQLADLVAASEPATAPDPLDDVVPFERLLGA